MICRVLCFLSFIIIVGSCVSGQKDSGTTGSYDTAKTMLSDPDINDNDTSIQDDYDAYEEYDYISELENELIGTWVNSSIRVDVYSFQNSDTSFIVDISEDAWDMKMTIRPIVTKILADGTYISEQRNFFDSLLNISRGSWMLDGDSLIMEDSKKNVYKYQIFIDGDRAEFRGMTDYDNDGKKDDRYFGVQKRKE